MSTAEVTAYLYGAKLAREVADGEQGDPDTVTQVQSWLGPGEFAAIDKIGLRRFNYWSLEGQHDHRRA